MSTDRTQGSTHHNALVADGVVGSVIEVGSVLTGSQIIGSVVETPLVTGSSITGSEITLPADGALGGMAETVTGTTEAASANFSKTHSLGVSPTFVGITAHGTNGSNTLNLVTKDSAAIVVESALGTVAFEALLVQ